MTNLITKEILFHLYNEKAMSLTEIAHKFGFSQFHPIKSLFLEYQIPLMTQVELIAKKQEIKFPRPQKQSLEQDILIMSVTQMTKKYNTNRKTMDRWLTEYQIQSPYFVNKDIKPFLFLEENKNLSPKQLAVKYNTDTTTINYYKKNWIEKSYTNDEIKTFLNNYDLTNQGLSKQIRFDDPNIYNSILENTNNHPLTTKKITERVFRILNNYDIQEIDCCSNCCEPIIFYTMEKGYNRSPRQLCKKCSMVYGEHESYTSQIFFWNIYKKLNNNVECFFHELNYEKQIKVMKYDMDNLQNHPKLNKYKYYPDFIYGDKIIEFDGDYWHQDQEKEDIKDRFYKLKGYDVIHILHSEYNKNPQQIEEQCLTFLLNS